MTPKKQVLFQSVSFFKIMVLLGLITCLCGLNPSQASADKVSGNCAQPTFSNLIPFNKKSSALVGPPRFVANSASRAMTRSAFFNSDGGNFVFRCAHITVALSARNVIYKQRRMMKGRKKLASLERRIDFIAVCKCVRPSLTVGQVSNLPSEQVANLLYPTAGRTPLPTAISAAAFDQR